MGTISLSPGWSDNGLPLLRFVIVAQISWRGAGEGGMAELHYLCDKAMQRENDQSSVSVIVVSVVAYVCAEASAQLAQIRRFHSSTNEH